MDFRSVLNLAAENSGSSVKNGKYYSTKFEAPKRETKEKKLSANIQKFLAQKAKEDEDKERLRNKEARDRLSKRDNKEKNKINKMLKTTKSAMKFQTGEGESGNNPEQPDEDDYGFVSHESENLYKKLMDKYQKIPEEKKFVSGGCSKHRVVSKEEMQSTKDRVKQALTRDKEDEANPQRQRQSRVKSDNNDVRERIKDLAHVGIERKERDKPRPKVIVKQAPIVDFQALLKLAEQKQHEPIKMEIQSKKKDPERLMTSKEKREQEELDAFMKAKEARAKGRIPKLNSAIPRLNDSKQDRNNNDGSSKQVPRANGADKFRKPLNSSDKLVKPSTSTSSKLQSALQKPQSSVRPSQSAQKAILGHNNKSQPTSSKTVANNSKSKDVPSRNTIAQRPGAGTSAKDMKNIRAREFPPRDVQKTREFPPRDVQRTREFPPRDVQRTREFPPRDHRRPQQMQGRKRNVIEDEDSDEDSEMDDFIDDGEEATDYSSAIKEIFGYDKSRYRDEDFDDRQMESNYSSIMREEFISKKIGIMEDLEDMRREEEEEKRKEMMRKKRRLK
ncbi:unnamed protein product [Diamesa tonsa]